MENTKMINGCSKKEIIDKIEAGFSPDLIDYDRDGHAYFPAWAYQNRMNEVVGIFNYDFVVSPHQIVTFKDKHYVTTIGTLTIRYDDGTPALVREAEGGTAIIVIQSTGQPKELTNDIKMAATDAFKACCRKLGMAEKQLQSFKKKNQNNNGNNSQNNQNNRNNGQNNRNNGQGNKNNSNNSATPASEEDFRVVITGKFESLNGKGYKAPAKDVKTDEIVSLVFWADAIQKVEEKIPMKDFCETYVNKQVSVIAQKKTYNGKNGPEVQLTVRGFANPAQKTA